MLKGFFRVVYVEFKLLWAACVREGCSASASEVLKGLDGGMAACISDPKNASEEPFFSGPLKAAPKVHSRNFPEEAKHL